MSIYAEVSFIVLCLLSSDSGSIGAYQIKGKWVQTNMQASENSDLKHPLASRIGLKGQILKCEDKYILSN